MKKHTTFYITRELHNLMDFLIGREEISRTLFLKRAIRAYIRGNHKVDARVLITQKTHPDYIRRDAIVNAYIEFEQYRELEQIAEEVSYSMKRKCTVSQLIFWALVEYCSDLAQQNREGITIVDNRLE